MNVQLPTSRRLRIRLGLLDACLPVATMALMVLYLLAVLHLSREEWQCSSPSGGEPWLR